MMRPPFKTKLELLSETHAEKYSQSVVSDGYVKLRFSPKFVGELFSGATHSTCSSPKNVRRVSVQVLST